jgi:4-alpha-glucanotransferase
VRKLKKGMNLPGMKILQFAFDNNHRNDYLPHNIKDKNCIVYTGTHDNDTTNGWFYDTAAPENFREYIMEYLGLKEWSDFHLSLIRCAYATHAELAVIPAQDLLGYGSEYRMNTPGTIGGNWLWKLTSDKINSDLMKKMRRLAELYSRLPEQQNEHHEETNLNEAD